MNSKDLKKLLISFKEAGGIIHKNLLTRCNTFIDIPSNTTLLELSYKGYHLTIISSGITAIEETKSGEDIIVFDSSLHTTYPNTYTDEDELLDYFDDNELNIKFLQELYIELTDSSKTKIYVKIETTYTPLLNCLRKLIYHLIPYKCSDLKEVPIGDYILIIENEDEVEVTNITVKKDRDKILWHPQEFPRNISSSLDFSPTMLLLKGGSLSLKINSDGKVQIPFTHEDVNNMNLNKEYITNKFVTLQQVKAENFEKGADKE